MALCLTLVDMLLNQCLSQADTICGYYWLTVLYASKATAGERNPTDQLHSPVVLQLLFCYKTKSFNPLIRFKQTFPKLNFVSC